MLSEYKPENLVLTDSCDNTTLFCSFSPQGQKKKVDKVVQINDKIIESMKNKISKFLS